jgi:orotidine-5'-phosphate decarboxylase
MVQDALAAAKERLIFALDVPRSDQAEALVDQLADEVGCFKIGLELFIAAGPDLVRRVVARAPVFLDLKLHDIPATVERATRVADELGVRYLTVHADLGGRSLAAAAAAAERTRILAITVLTSVADADLGSAGIAGNVGELVLKRAALAATCGCAGLVCSGQEVARVRAATPSLERITPGVRPAGSEAGDQARVVTPNAAIAAGATSLVVGRPIRDAKDRAAAARAIVAEIAGVVPD